MKPEVNAVTEDDLLAYVDGLLDDKRARQVEAYLEQHPHEAEKIERWSLQNEAIHSLYDPVADEPVPAALDVHRLADARRLLGGWHQAIAAAAVICLTIGGIGGWYGRSVMSPVSSAAPSLVAEAIDAHNLYAGEVIHPVEVHADGRNHLAVWLSKRLDRSISAPDLSKAGFSLIGGRLLPAGAKPAAQFMYQDKSGRRVTLYIVPEARGRETSFHFAEIDRLDAFYWRDETISCAMVGDLPRDDLHDLAIQAYRQLT